MYVYIGFKTSFYVVRHLDFITRLHMSVCMDVCVIKARSMISGFRHQVDEICALLGYYAA